MTMCIECGRPWGVLLDRGEMPSDERQQLAQAELIEGWLEIAECDEEGPFDTSKLPKCRAAEVVYLTEALAAFCDTNGICDPCFLDDCWQELRYVEVPAWLLKGRKRRWAYLWDCCEIGWASNYVMANA